MMHPTDGTWKRIVLLDGDEIQGPILFQAFGAAGAYPGFYKEGTRRWYPLHAVKEAHR